MTSVEVRSPATRLEAGRAPPACDAFRDWLAGLALGAGARAGDAALAGHARLCRACDAFADDVGEARRWLFAASRAGPVGGDGGRVTPGCWRALAVQLRARLARDLLGRARREPPRERERVEADLERLAAVERRLGRDTGRARRVGALLDARDPSRARLLGLAAHLDPLALDVALAWIGWLLHAGHRRHADRVADRIYGELPGFRE